MYIYIYIGLFNFYKFMHKFIFIIDECIYIYIDAFAKKILKSNRRARVFTRFLLRADMFIREKSLRTNHSTPCITNMHTVTRQYAL